MLFLAQTDGGNDINKCMALRKFSFTRDGGFWSVFVDDLEPNGGQNLDRREIFISEGSTKLKNTQKNIQNAEIIGFGYSARILSTSQ